ncbi:MAG: hypothetical protein BGO50_16680 [Rhodanobacter sp. 67-28]|nr:MAG: hypothetical protein ABS98_15395 [Xanthomonadaceae bacterium SCN 69-48]OJW43860.1 MAG: hypothetical protein BGO50_16680 [Rhodanobacter sp. 67-28]
MEAMTESRVLALRAIELPPEESGAMLDRVLRRLRMKPLALDLFEKHPNLAVASRRFVWLVSPTLLYPYGKRTIAEHCLAEAILGGTQSSDNPVRAYVEGLLAKVTMLLEVRVTSGPQTWNPVTDQPLMTWLQDRPDAIVDNEAGPIQPLPVPRAFAASIALRVLDPLDYQFVPGLAGEAT